MNDAGAAAGPAGTPGDVAAAFAARLAEVRAAVPRAEVAEVFVTDLNGLARGKLVPIEMLAKLGAGRMRLPISSLALDVFTMDVPETGLALERGDPDGVLIPVPETLAPMLWAARPTLQCQAMLSDEGGAAVSALDPRGILAGVVRRAEAMGFAPVMALELEFYLIDPEHPLPPQNPQAGGRLKRAQVYDMDVIRAFEPVLGRIAEAARALGAPTETAICEFGPGQFEINLAHAGSALTACDHTVALRRAIRGVARGAGLDASFMAKPFGDMAGSGLHLHLSLRDADGAPAFAAGAADGGPGALLRAAVAGVLDSLPDTMLVHAPHLNSYRRFAPGSYAPMVAAWGLDNRGAAVRVPEATGPGARLETRLSGADANPYLVAAAVLSGALAGIEAGLAPPAPVAAEPGEGEGTPLPLSWAMAEQAFSASPAIAPSLGAAFQRVFAAMKRQERATLMAQVPDIEYEAYLRVV
ncbi:MAG: glutamine synthetase family protein [Pseudomonadota bacterium]